MQKEKDIDILARTIYGEARGESKLGKMAVASVILNRYKSGKWFAGKTIEETCKKPWQFSCWNFNDVNRDKILKATDEELGECLTVARDAINGAFGDVAMGSCHYHTKNCKPSWAVGKIPITAVGNHLFYKDID